MVFPPKVMRCSPRGPGRQTATQRPRFNISLGDSDLRNGAIIEAVGRPEPSSSGKHSRALLPGQRRRFGSVLHPALDAVTCWVGYMSKTTRAAVLGGQLRTYRSYQKRGGRRTPVLSI